MTFNVRPEIPADHAAVEALHDRVFGADRHTKTSYRYRVDQDPIHELCHVAADGAQVVGAIRYWPVHIGGAPALLLGPLGIEPTRRGEGIGVTLVRRTLDLAAAGGHRVVVLVGEVSYYGQFGFAPAALHGIVMPEEAPHRLLVRGLAPDALSGVRGDVAHWSGVRGLDGGHVLRRSPTLIESAAPG